MLGAIGESEECQVRKVLKDHRDVEVLQLTDGQRENLVAGGIKLFLKLVSCLLGVEFFEEALNVLLEVRLLVTVSMLLLLNVFHVLLSLALFLPVEFLVDVARSVSDLKLATGRLDNLLLDIFVCNAVKLGVQSEVFSYDLDCDLLKTLNLVGGEGRFVIFLGLHHSLGDESVVESFLFGYSIGVRLSCLARGRDLSC